MALVDFNKDEILDLLPDAASDGEEAGPKESIRGKQLVADEARAHGRDAVTRSTAFVACASLPFGLTRAACSARAAHS